MPNFDQMFMMWIGGMIATLFVTFIVRADGKLMQHGTTFYMYLSIVFWPVLLPFTAIVMLFMKNKTKKGPKNDRTIH